MYTWRSSEIAPPPPPPEPSLKFMWESYVGRTFIGNDLMPEMSVCGFGFDWTGFTNNILQ